MSNKKYIIDEETLRDLVYRSLKLEVLEIDGVDNWQWYMEGVSDFVKEYLGEDYTEHSDLEDIVDIYISKNYKQDN